MTSVPERLRARLTAAIKARDAVGVAALRSALAAIENAGAVDVPDEPTPLPTSEHVAGAAVGLAAAQAERRWLGPDEERRIVRSEADQRRAAAAQYETLGRGREADRLRAEADVLERFLTADDDAEPD